MSSRPLVLIGSEKLASAGAAPPADDRFDGATGVWRDATGALSIRAAGQPATVITATREGVDQSERSGGGTTRITETREGIDQTERAN